MYRIFLWPTTQRALMDPACWIRDELLLRGYDVPIESVFRPGYRYIVIGANGICYRPLDETCYLPSLTDEAWEDLGEGQVPKNAIIVNLEQLYDGNRWTTSAYMDLLTHHPVWDYSVPNVTWLKRRGISATLIHFGWSRSMLPLIPVLPVAKDIDVLFYGFLNDRRLQIKTALEQQGLSVVFREYNLWDEERDRLINRSKIVLNIHGYPANIFESARVFLLLARRAFVITELSVDDSEYTWLMNGLVYTTYDTLVATVRRYLPRLEERERIADFGYHLLHQRTTSIPIPAAQTLYLDGPSGPPKWLRPYYAQALTVHQQRHDTGPDSTRPVVKVTFALLYDSWMTRACRKEGILVIGDRWSTDLPLTLMQEGSIDELIDQINRALIIVVTEPLLVETYAIPLAAGRGLVIVTGGCYLPGMVVTTPTDLTKTVIYYLERPVLCRALGEAAYRSAWAYQG